MNQTSGIVRVPRDIAERSIAVAGVSTAGRSKAVEVYYLTHW
jgi:hypothetical protein